MRLRSLTPAAALLVVVSAATARADVTEYKIDPNHTLIGFDIRHFFARVNGRFKDFSGTIRFDDQDMSKSTVDVTIQAASINTENEHRDNDLRSAHFFLVDSFPTVTFKSTKIVAGPDNSALVYGDLTMRGITKQVTLDSKFLGSMMDTQMGRKMAGFEGKTTINRKDFNIVWNRTLDQGATMLGDDVNIKLQVEGFWRDPNASPPQMGARPPQGQPDKK